MEIIFLPATALAAAYFLDLALGDPRRLPHPVRLIGRIISFLERLFRRFCQKPRAQKAAGAALVFLVGGGAAALASLAVYGAFRVHLVGGFLLLVYIYYAVLAAGDMIRHVEDVGSALQNKDLVLARERVSLLVSRETAGLEEEGVARAALESLFENTADGVAAPLFYAALGGPALAVLYKAVNTMDSMLGYREKHYLHLGWAAARADDLLGWLPARLTALAFILAGFWSGLSWKKGWTVLLKDRKKHESPNSAWPEAAAAGVLDLRLGGADVYKGKTQVRPYLNETGKPPGEEDLKRALRLFRLTTALLGGGALLLSVVSALVWSL